MIMFKTDVEDGDDIVSPLPTPAVSQKDQNVV